MARAERMFGNILVLAAVLLLTLLTASPAVAIEPPAIDPGAVPRDATGPEQPLEQRHVCNEPLTTPGRKFTDPPWSNPYLGVDKAHHFATGAGITVALIDTGVTASPRVPAEPGGDFVAEDGDGLTDCDAHGTLVASLIAGRPAPTDGFIGVAPDARLISIRQTSAAYEPKDNTHSDDPDASPAAGTVRSLARAVVHAANLGAQVINISEAACFKATNPIDEKTLGAALDYAVNAKGAVVIAAAGNTGNDCSQNPEPDPAIPNDPRGWGRVQTIVTPAWYEQLVLTVGSFGETGQPSAFSMHGPWVGAAAPGENIVALGPKGDPVDALPGKDGPLPIAGTSFSAAYVSGVAALLRQRFPDLPPAEIVKRITASARHPAGGTDDAVGAGVVDAHAALTWHVAPEATKDKDTVKRIEPPIPIPSPDLGPITAVGLGFLGLLLALGLATLTGRALRRR